MNIIKVKSTESTNLFLKDWAKRQHLNDGTVIVAEEQTAGRGQEGTQWESETGKNITCSTIIYPDSLPAGQAFLISKAVAVGIKDVLDAYINPVFIKWPNDIYFEERKIAGILIENELSGRWFTQSIIGIGLNVNQDMFTSDAPNPVSLKQILGREMDVNALLKTLIERILFRYGQLQSGQAEEISQIYEQALYHGTGYFDYKDKNGLFRAQIQSVANNGILHLLTDKGEKRRYAFKEVSFVQDKTL